MEAFLVLSFQVALAWELFCLSFPPNISLSLFFSLHFTKEKLTTHQSQIFPGGFLVIEKKKSPFSKQTDSWTTWTEYLLTWLNFSQVFPSHQPLEFDSFELKQALGGRAISCEGLSKNLSPSGKRILWSTIGPHHLLIPNPKHQSPSRGVYSSL